MATAVGLNMKITADTAGIGRGVSKTEQMLGKLSASAASASSSLRALVGIEVGTRLVSAFANAASAASDYALKLASSIDETAKLAQRTGITVEALQGLQVAAGLSGVGNLEGAIQRLTISVGDAGQGVKTAQDGFARLGLTFEDLAALAPEDQFRQVAAAISRLPSEAERAAAAADLFGRTGVELLPLFASNLEEVEARARRLGIVLSGDQTAAIEQMNDALSLVSQTFDGIIGQVTANLAPVVTDLADEFLAFVESFEGFGGAGGSGIADALTSGLLDFAEYVAEVFDFVLSGFSEFGATMEAVSSVFDGVASIFVAVSETLRGVFNIFEIAGNGISLALGKAIEYFGSFFSSDAEEFGRSMAENAIREMDRNTAQASSAFRNAGSAAEAAVFGRNRGAATGPAGRAVQDARSRFDRRNTPEAIAERERKRAARDAERQASLEARTQQRRAEEQAREAERIAEQRARAEQDAVEKARKAAEARLAEVQKVEDEITRAEEERLKRSTEIESARLDELNKASTAALNVGDVRSGGIDEVLRLASGREDPAISEYRKQLAELQKIDQKLDELRTERVEIIGGAKGRAA